ncbi:acyl-CoA oxidase [Hortaea werneckii]|nr:acyl-CoA oxidase [Hortaea werneckii]
MSPLAGSRHTRGRCRRRKSSLKDARDFRPQEVACRSASSILGHLGLAGIVEGHHRLAGKVESKSGGEERKQADLDGGVVQDLVLALLPLGGIAILELPADSTVTGGNGHTPSEDATGLHDDGTSNPGQGAVDKRRAGGTLVFVRLGVDAGEASQHVDVGDLDLVEEQVAIVHGVVAELGTDIADVDVLQRLVSVQVTDLDHEGVGAVGLASNDELGHDDGMVGGAAERANPPLAGGQGRGVDGEGLVVGIPGGGGLQPADVGAVAELGLSVTADVAVLLGVAQEALVLLGGALVAQGDEEHALVQAIGTGLGDELVGDHLVVLRPAMLGHELAQLLGAGQGGLEAVDAAGEVVLALVKHLLLLQHGEDAVLALEGVAGEEEVGELVDIDVGAVAKVGWPCAWIVLAVAGEVRLQVEVVEEEEKERTTYDDKLKMEGIVGREDNLGP